MNWHLRRDLRLKNFISEYVAAGVIVGLVLAAVGVFISATVFNKKMQKASEMGEIQFSYLAFTETVIDKDGNIVNASDVVILAERLAAVKKLRLSAEAVGSTYFGAFFSFGERIESERNSGKVSLVRIPTWGDFLKILYTRYLLWFWLLLGSCAFISFAFCSLDNFPSYWLLDLPWQKPWTWIFVLTTIPANIPFFAVSAIRIVWPSRINARLRINAGDQTQSEWQPDIRWIAPRKASVKTLGASEYVKAKDEWINLRAQLRHEEWQRRVATLRQRVEMSKRNLNSYGQNIIRAQDELAKAMRELRDAEAFEPPISIALPDILQVEHEFEQLMNLPQAARVEISKNEISITTHPAIIYTNGRPHDFGSYKITITVKRGFDGVKVQCVFSTKSHGSGHMYGGDRNGYFCFGSRRDTINGLLLRGEYLAAIILMLEGLLHVNAENERAASKLYPEVQNVPA